MSFQVAVKMFASIVDKDYEDTMMGCVGYSYVCKELLPLSCCNLYYGELLRHFLLCHFVLATIISLSYFTISIEKQHISKDEMMSQAELHKNHCIILFVICDLLCANSRDILKH